MAQLKITTDDFSLTSTWSCGIGDSSWIIATGPTTDSKTVKFEWASLGNVRITSAKIYATLGSPLTGAAIRTVNGIAFDSDGSVSVDISADDTFFDAVFRFKANGEVLPNYDERTSSQTYSDVYLLIEYEQNYIQPDLIEYTDPDPVRMETYVKAVHMTELHTNVNLIRVARKLDEYDFTSIVSMETSLAGWNNHVLEIRSAVDDMGIAHEDWIVLGENYPRLDVLLQLRRVVQAVSEA